MIVDCGHYRDGVRQHDGQMTLAEAARCRERDDGFVWIGILDPTEEELSRLASALSLHELAVEDAQRAHQRPKVEEYDQHTFIVLRTARYIDETETVEFGEIHMFLGRGFAVTVRHGAASDLADVRRRLEARPDLLSHGPAAVMWGVLDKVVDDYEPVVAGIENDIEEVEATVFGDDPEKADDPTRRIYFLRREVVQMFRAVHPLLPPLAAAERGDDPRLTPMREYFRDVNDHAKLVHDEVLVQRDGLQTVLDASIALLSHGQNIVVRRISAWAAIITVPTLIASIYGMNFQHMPELKWSVGYPLALAVMAGTALGLFRYFKRSGWL
jgi:magnesium transporter